MANPRIWIRKPEAGDGTVGPEAVCSLSCVEAAGAGWNVKDYRKLAVPAEVLPLIECAVCGFALDHQES